MRSEGVADPLWLLVRLSYCSEPDNGRPQMPHAGACAGLVRGPARRVGGRGAVCLVTALNGPMDRNQFPLATVPNQALVDQLVRHRHYHTCG